jgi:DNA mismatch repair protein MutS
LPGIAEICSLLGSSLIDKAITDITRQNNVIQTIENSINPDCPSHFREGGIIKKGFDPDLDELIEDAEGGKKWIAALQESERVRTGIQSLKVGFNKVFGYYIEVSRIHLEKVPDDYIGKQTLVNSQRYITSELKERENLILTADSRRIDMEKEIYSRVCMDISSQSHLLRTIGKAVAILDTVSSLADLSMINNYCRPVINGSMNLIISEGRHPVVEGIVGKKFIPNDLVMKPLEKQIMIITGPNMGGKSTYIRQAAIISILAHMGSFVPASRAEIGIMDRIFTRVGSSDNLAQGQSTFLVEMAETAKILHGCSSRSLVLLDEVGRGTSTLDGLSIAWAVTEYLLDNEKRRPKTLFATHYHELTDLSELNSKVHNLRVDVKEWGNSIVFLYKIVDGKSDRSYGIHVAQLAGLPDRVVQRAQSILETLEREAVRAEPGGAVESSPQLSMFEPHNRVRELLRNIDINGITPINALEILAELKELIKDN